MAKSKRKKPLQKFTVELAWLIRQTATVVVETDDPDSLQEQLSKIYEASDGSENWTDDTHWGAEEGSHQIHGEADKKEKADFTIFNGEVSKVG